MNERPRDLVGTGQTLDNLDTGQSYRTPGSESACRRLPLHTCCKGTCKIEQWITSFICDDIKLYTCMYMCRDGRSNGLNRCLDAPRLAIKCKVCLPELQQVVLIAMISDWFSTWQKLLKQLLNTANVTWHTYTIGMATAKILNTTTMVLTCEACCAEITIRALQTAIPLPKL